MNKNFDKSPENNHFLTRIVGIDRLVPKFFKNLKFFGYKSFLEVFYFRNMICSFLNDLFEKRLNTYDDRIQTQQNKISEIELLNMV